MSKWFHRTPGEKDQFRLFCFPYAGGGASIFSKWQKGVDQKVSFYPVQLPGRESRLQDEPYKNLDLLVEDFVEFLEPYLTKSFAFFGHSMGALISYEVAKKLEEKTPFKPEHLFVSARTAPHVDKSETRRYQLSNAEFIQELERLNGTKKEVLKNRELIEILLPSIRADFELFETYKYTPGSLLSSPITVFGGMKDKEVDHSKLSNWQELSKSNEFHIHMFEGEHFFLHQEMEAITNIISQTLLR